MSDAEKRIVKFVKDYTVDDCRKGTSDEESYAKDQRVSLNAASADRFIDMGVAVLARPAEKKASRGASKKTAPKKPAAKKAG